MPNRPQEELTNENLSSLFSDNFQLAITAIRLAQNYIKGSHEVSLSIVLNEIKKHPHMYQFEDVVLMGSLEDTTE